LSRDGAELIRIAEEIYSENLFSNLPLLADALERAGCSDIKILSHCRKPGQHVRGCWVIDALLRKESGIKIGLTTEADWLLCKDLRPLLHYLCERGSERKWRLFSVACCRRVDHLITDESSRDAVELAERFADGRATEEELAEAHAKAKQEVEESHHAEWMAEAEANFCYTAEYCAVVAVLEVAAAVESVVSLSARPTSTASGMTGTHGFAAGAVASMARSKAYADWGMKSAGVYEACQAAADAAHESEVAHQLLILRDIFGDQFGPVRNESRWLSWSGGSERWSLLPSPRKIDFDRSWLEWNNCIVRKMAKEIYDKRAFDQMHALADALVQAGCTNADILTHCRSGGEHVRGCWVVDLLLGNA
jgi:hypothetical protein